MEGFQAVWRATVEKALERKEAWYQDEAEKKWEAFCHWQNGEPYEVTGSEGEEEADGLSPSETEEDHKGDNKTLKSPRHQVMMSCLNTTKVIIVCPATKGKEPEGTCKLYLTFGIEVSIIETSSHLSMAQ